MGNIKIPKSEFAERINKIKDIDFNRLLTVLWRKGEPDRIPFFELSIDHEVMDVIEPVNLSDGLTLEEKDMRYIQRLISFCTNLGYDYVGLSAIGIGFLGGEELYSEEPSGERSWTNLNKGPVSSWEDFKKYPWRDIDEKADYVSVDKVTKLLPPRVKIIAHFGSMYGYVEGLMGYVPFCQALYDEPKLVAELFERVGTLVHKHFRRIAAIDAVGAICIPDDLAFKTATLISTEHLRKYVFPWYKKFIEEAHRQNKPVILHSDGNLEEVMDELIDEVGFDARHGYEDVIMPIFEVKKKYKDRIAILGGIDVDFLSRHSEEDVRRYTRKVISECGPGGGYALGSGNSITRYIGAKKFLAMLDEGRKYGRYPIKTEGG